MVKIATRIGCTLVMLVVLMSSDVQAQRSGLSPAVLEEVGVDEKFGERIPMDVEFLDETGRSVRLGDYFGGERPVVLTMTYHDCPMLCNLILDEFTRSLKQLSWVPGREFDVVSVSFSPRDTPEMASNVKRRLVNDLGSPEASEGWHFLTADQASIDSLAAAIGFRYTWVEEQQDYAHPAVLTFLSGDGMISRYIYGLEYPPRHIRNALVEASEGKIGTPLDQVILFCFQYDPEANSYVLHAVNLMKIGGLLTVMVLGSLLFILWRKEHDSIEEGLRPHSEAAAV